MRLSLTTTLVGLIFTAAAFSADEPPGHPNILLMLSDDHSCPHVGCYGNPDIKTPNLDRLASEGMRFDRAYVACPQCVPSRAAIMTGRSPVRIAMTRFSAPLPMDAMTYKLIYNALWQIPYTPVDFIGDAFWKELGQMNAEGKLSKEMSRIYFSPTRPMFELYDLEKDPSEFDNLAGREGAQAVEHELRAALVEWMVLERDFLPLPIPGSPPANRR